MIFFALIAGFMAVIILLLTINHTPLSITKEDTIYIEKIVADAGYDIHDLKYTTDFEAQIDTIETLQNAVFHTTPDTHAIPKNNTREPKDLYIRSSANCSDRSRFLHKALRHLGFEVRYASVYSLTKAGSVYNIIFGKNQKGADSHALIEVKTAKGWMFVDTVSPWVAINADNKPIGLMEWQHVADKENYAWQPQAGHIFSVLEDDFLYVYGLYSMHGLFYPPYIYFPDINIFEMRYNLIN